MTSLSNHKIITTTKIVFTLLFCLFILPSFGQRTYTIILDAGHGGKDPGNLGNGYKEKHIALKVAKAVGKELKKRRDIKVVFTRETDVFINLWKRGAIANEAQADLFVSIHCDSHTSNAFGAGTFVLGLRGNKQNLEIAKRENASILMEDNYEDRYKGFDPNSAESVIGLSLLQEENLDKSLEIASLIQTNFTRSLNRRDRSVKQDNFQVLRETIMPSVLVELGFLTNLKEGRYLNSAKGQQEMGKAIAGAVQTYVDRLKLNSISLETDASISKTVKKSTTEKNIKPNSEGKVAIDQEKNQQIKKERAKIDDITYKIQIASSTKKIPLKSYNFKGLKNVTRVKVGRYFKYYYTLTSDYNKANKALKEAKKKGYSSAFVVAFKNGAIISVRDARKIQ